MNIDAYVRTCIHTYSASFMLSDFNPYLHTYIHTYICT